MNKHLILITSLLLSNSLFAAEQVSKLKQDIYLAGSVGSHELEKESGIKYGFHFGAKNIYRNNFLLGGELEVAAFDNNDFKKEYGVSENYSYSANIPLGRRFNLNEQTAIDVYGLVGYTATRLDLGYTEDTIDGFKLGAGTDLSFPDWSIGLRYTHANIDGDRVTKELAEKNISLLIAYKIKI